MLLTTEQSLAPFLLRNYKTERRRVIVVAWQDSSKGKSVIFKKEKK